MGPAFILHLFKICLFLLGISSACKAMTTLFNTFFTGTPKMFATTIINLFFAGALILGVTLIEKDHKERHLRDHAYQRLLEIDLEKVIRQNLDVIENNHRLTQLINLAVEDATEQRCQVVLLERYISRLRLGLSEESLATVGARSAPAARVSQPVPVPHSG